MKLILGGSTKKEGFYIRNDKCNSSHPGVHDCWLGYKQANGDVHEQRITELAYVILRSEKNRMSPKKKY